MRIQLAHALALTLLAASAAAQQCELQKWTEPGAEHDDQLGYRIALEGDRAAVSDVEGNSTTGNDVGAVHVFRRTPTRWVREARLTLGAGVGFSFFGGGLAFQGELLAIGAPVKDGPYVESGAVYLYERVGSEWLPRQVLQPENMSYGQRRFGESIDIDGNRMLIGAMVYDGAQEETGAAFIFERRAGTWIETAMLFPADGDTLDFFGGAVVLSGDIAIVGASTHDSLANKEGAVYVFSKTGTQWLQTDKVAPTELTIDARFGTSMSLDGSTLVVGAPQWNDGVITPGAVFVFELVGGKLLSPRHFGPAQPISNGDFGFSVSLSGDRLLVGAPAVIPSTSEGPPGTSELFQLVQDEWQSIDLYVGPSPDSRFGAAVALGPETLITGAPHDDGAASETGSVFFGLPLPGASSRFCESTPNSVGDGVSMDFSGSLSLSDNDMIFTTTGGVPDAFGIFIYGPEQTETPFGSGVLCVAPGQSGLIYLYPPTMTGILGTLQYQANWLQPPFNAGPGRITPGSTWNFQSIYRDSVGGVPVWNLSDALSLRFCP